MEKWRIHFLFLLIFLGSSVGLPYGKDSSVIELNKKNFAETVFNSEHVWLVEFYAPWCGHCQRLAPEWEKLAKSMKGIIKVAAVNGDVERELAQHYQIQGFPTIKLFPSQLQKAPQGEGYLKVPEDYNGPRTASAMANYAISKLPNFITKVTSKNIDEFIGSPDMGKVLLFTNKKETTSLYKAIAIDFHFRLNLGEVRDTEKEVVSKYGITKFPSLLVIPPTGGEPIVYDGELKHDSLSNFLKPYAKEPPKRSKTTPPPPQKEAPPPEPIRPVKDEVADQATFESICFNTNKNCIITILDIQNSSPEEHEQYLAVLDQVQQKHGKTFNFIWIDAQKASDFVDTWNLASGYPSVIIFNHKKQSIVPYIGAFSEPSFNEFLSALLRGAKRAIPITKVPSIQVKSQKDEL